MGRLNGKIAVVTGAGAPNDLRAAEATIGMATALRFAQEGAYVVVVDLRQDDVLRTKAWMQSQALDCAPSVGDIASLRAREQVVARCIEAHGRLDILQNNAATGWTFQGRLLEQPPAAFESNLGVNLLGTLNMCRAASLHLQASRGAIVNVSSISARLPQMWPELSAYNLSKAALNFATRQVAADFAPAGVRVNGIMPGTIDTPSNRRLAHQTHGAEAAAYQASRREIVPLQAVDGGLSLH